MKLMLTIDSHVYKKTDGTYWCTGITDYNFVKRYLSAFDSVILLARVKEMEKNEDIKYVRLCGKNVNVVELPFSRSVKEYAFNYFKYKKIIKEGINIVDCIILRVPSVVAGITFLNLKNKDIPLGAEVVADLSDAKSIFTRVLFYITKKICMKAKGVSYVTEKYLQTIYPCKALELTDSTYFTTNYSSIELKDEHFGSCKYYNDKKQYTIVHTANKSKSTAKGQDVVIKALAILREKGYNVNVKFIGDSEIKEYYYKLANELNVHKYINFTGLLSFPILIKKELESGDFFVFPTKMEGLPRAVIEAMAVGLPCLSTPVAGIPELLDGKYLYDQSDYQSFANSIIDLINDPEECSKISMVNINKAKEYKSDILDRKREEFYIKLKNTAHK